MERETGSITSKFLAKNLSFLYVNVVILPGDLLVFERILRPLYSSSNTNKDSVVSLVQCTTRTVLTEVSNSASS
jgi:hypothetical protein